MAFGLRIARLLSADTSLTLISVGRDAQKAADAAARLSQTAQRHVESACLDAATTADHDIARIAPRVLINASGPFQTGTL